MPTPKAPHLPSGSWGPKICSLPPPRPQLPPQLPPLPGRPQGLLCPEFPGLIFCSTWMTLLCPLLSVPSLIPLREPGLPLVKHFVGASATRVVSRVPICFAAACLALAGLCLRWKGSLAVGDLGQAASPVCPTGKRQGPLPTLPAIGDPGVF